MSLCTTQFTIYLSGNDKYDILCKKTRQVKATLDDHDDAVEKMLELQQEYDNDLKNSVPAVFRE